MKNSIPPKMYALIFALLIVLSGCSKQTSTSNNTLKSTLLGKFYIGTALDSQQIIGKDTASLHVIKSHFNSIVAENCMKSEVIQPKEGKFDFKLADQFVAFGETNNMFMIGHTLIWHSQAAPWFFVDGTGNDVSKEVLIERMKKHIHTIVTRYKGRIQAWDVVNEAFEDDGSYRKSKFYTIIGEEYIPLAFQFAQEADSTAELYYNDYSMIKEGKRKAVVGLIEELKQAEIRIDAVGMQGHYSMTYPQISQFENSLKTFANTGVQVMITELDISVIPSPYEMQGADIATRFQYSEKMDPYKNGLPDSAEVAFNKRYMEFFNVCLKHQDKVSRITLWGVNDAQSWRNYWPIKGRTDYPLLFDRENSPKSIVTEIINAAKSN